MCSVPPLEFQEEGNGNFRPKILFLCRFPSLYLQGEEGTAGKDKQEKWKTEKILFHVEIGKKKKIRGNEK